MKFYKGLVLGVASISMVVGLTACGAMKQQSQSNGQKPTTLSSQNNSGQSSNVTSSTSSGSKPHSTSAKGNDNTSENGKSVIQKISKKTPILDTGFQKFFQNGNMTYIVSLNKQLSFKMVDLGGGAGSFDYEFYKSTNDGQTWIKQSKTTLHYAYGLSFINQTTGFVVNNVAVYSITPTMRVTHDGGKHWSEIDLPIPKQYDFKNNGYIREAKYPVFFNTSLGIMPVFGAQGSITNNNYLYMLVTTDGGNTWRTVTTNKYANVTWSSNNSTVVVNYKNKKITLSS